MNNTPPILVIGMHRSGTSLLNRVLDEAGVFMGADLDPNHESLFFMDINRWLLAQSGGRWDTPETIRYLLENKDVFEVFRSHVYNLLQSKYAKEFLGDIYGKPCCSLLQLNFPWGWKDPRSTMTLPLWQSIFPEARIIHVYRHGVDVAASLRVREKKSISGRRRHHDDVFVKKDLMVKKVVRSCLYDPYSKSEYDFNRKLPPRPVDSLRCSSLQGAFSLWEEYIETAFRMERHAEGRFLSIKYEDLLENPQAQIQQLFEFIEVTSTQSLLDQLASSMNPSRAYAYRKDCELVEFEKTVSPLLKKYGY